MKNMLFEARASYSKERAQISHAQNLKHFSLFASHMETHGSTIFGFRFKKKAQECSLVSRGKFG